MFEIIEYTTGVGAENAARMVREERMARGQANGEPSPPGTNAHIVWVAYVAADAMRQAMESGPPPPSAVVHPVPFQSQWGAEANASRPDCGPAAMAMVINYLLHGGKIVETVNDITREMDAIGRYTSTADFFRVARRRHMRITNHGAYDQNNGVLSADVMRQALTANDVVVALVNYGTFAPGAKFTGSHWVVVRGFDNGTPMGPSFYYLDPYAFDEGDGGDGFIDENTLTMAMQNVALNGNQPMHGVTIGV